ncbi:MAG: anti-sigma regulatory factor (Ser/Thr protein kinase) [Bryobacterales bacterium]|nr:anti-sigma regulatory factor (Ser/Thr protein kinase) [Bryobacterales bacterium]
MFPVTEETQVFEARRIALKMAGDLDWSPESAGELAIVVTEMATNLVKHAHGGQIHLSFCRRAASVGIEVLSYDRGPGAAELRCWIPDGFSTAGTPGTGLGAIVRLSDEFDAYSQEEKGTCMVARLYAESDDRKAEGPSFTVGAVRAPVAGERECGDNWGVRTVDGKLTLLLADGLGHGPGAAEASREAVAILPHTEAPSPESIVAEVHRALRHTRGAAVAAAQIDPAGSLVRFCGIGNISGMVMTQNDTSHMVSHNGTAGHNARKIQEFSYGWSPGAMLVMHSDGITTSWRMEAYPGLLRHHPSLLAATLFRDASRGRDDACVVAVRGGQ